MYGHGESNLDVRTQGKISFICFVNYLFVFLFQTFKLVHYFPHPLNKERKIYVFPDAPHLIKRFRVHILNKGVNFDFEGKPSSLTKEDFERLLAEDGAHGELRRLHKLKYVRSIEVLFFLR